MEEKKKSNIGIILLMIILLCAAFAGGYFVNEKGLIGGEKETPKEEGKEEKEDKVTVYDVTDEKVSSLINNFSAVFLGDCTFVEKVANDKKITVNDINNSGAYNLVGTKFDDSKDTISMEEFKKEVAKYFGKDYKFEVSDLMGKGKSCVPYYYDSSSNSFKHQQPECGWTCGPHSTYSIASAVDTNGTLKMNVKVLFYVSHDNSSNVDVFGDYAKTKKLTTFDFNTNTAPYIELIEYDKVDTYEFTFKNEDGNYVFVSSELKK